MTRASITRDIERIDASFLLSAPGLAHAPPEDEPEIAFAGRSNSGKSSVLNRLTGNRHTAKVSRTPGRTQLLNFFAVRGGGRIVDLPGYGYAKAERSAQARWQSAVNEYLECRPNLRGLVVVMDIRHPLQPLDIDLLRWATTVHMPTLLLLNKADKLAFGAQQQTLQRVRSSVRAAGADPATTSVITFSALRAQNVGAVIELVGGWLKTDN
jgi:GTP-binding protein